MLRYEILEAPRLAYACHCRDCQRLTGSAFSMGLVVAAEAFRLLQGEVLSYRRTTDRGRVATRWVCSGCGTWVTGGPRPGTAPPGTLVVVRAGTLDDTAWVRPRVHFWTSRAQPWVVLPEGDRRYETQPADFGWQPILDALEQGHGATSGGAEA
jgi:hypothetical protein